MKSVNPFLHSDSNKRYYTYDYFLRQKFGRKCARITIDAGFSCPNIDGTVSYGGCIYCTAPQNQKRIIKSFEEQYKKNREKESKKWPDSASIVYFNEGTNTYCETDYLESLIKKALSYSEVVGISIATRIDAIKDDMIDMLREYSTKTFLTLELGLQTTNDKTAEYINRGHNFSQFVDMYNKLYNINKCIHIINGLPGETEEDMIKTIKDVSELNPDMVKIHMLYLSTGTKLSMIYEEKPFHILTLNEYVNIVCNQLELLPENTVIGRLTGDGESDKLIEPQWSKKKLVVMNEIDKELARRNSYQGIYNKK